MASSIVTIENKKNEKFLRQKTAEFDFKKFTKAGINDLVLRMKKCMREAQGIGLSANQIGLNLKMFVAEVPTAQNKMKFYAVFNPKIEKFGGEKISAEEGCLSIPLTYGNVDRAEKITITGQDKNGKELRIKAWGLLARVFQHEIDHLNGNLFVDRAKEVHKIDMTHGNGISE